MAVSAPCHKLVGCRKALTTMIHELSETSQQTAVTNFVESSGYVKLAAEDYSLDDFGDRTLNG